MSRSQVRSQIIDLIEATWGGYANIDFNWLGTCLDGSTWTPCGSASCNTSADITIYLHENAPWACSRVGTDSASQRSTDCPGTTAGAEHNWASLELFTRDSEVANFLQGGTTASGDDRGTTTCAPNCTDAPRAPGFFEQTVVHEFGHALGLAHEQDHSQSDSMAECGSASNPNPAYVDFGPYDPFSVMNYCHQTNRGYTAPELSPGDIATIQALYGKEATIPRIQATSWYHTDLTVRVGFGPFTASTQLNDVSYAPEEVSLGSPNAGEAYSVSAENVQDARLTCNVTKPGAPHVYGHPRTALPNNFEEKAVRISCYDAAALAASVL